MLENWIKEANSSEPKNQILSFSEYMNIFEERSKQECRPTFLYLRDMVNYFGKDKNGNYSLFIKEEDNSPAVYGQKKVQEQILQNLDNFKEEGLNNKFILLVGPNGSSKSSIVGRFMKGAEEYSKTNEGALYSFSWIFPIDHFTKGSLGIGSNRVDEKSHLGTYSKLEDKEISAILTSELKDHPLLLIPKKYRQEIIEKELANDKDFLSSVKKSYLYQGGLSKRNRMIYDALLKNYKGDHNEVLKHIRIERFQISKRYSTSAVTIEPQIHVDARMQQITMDKRLASLPPSLQSLNLYSLQGETILANRGILEFSDLLKRPLDAFKYLLMTMETGTLNLQGILTELDILFIGSSNEIHLAAFKQHPDFNSFKGRFNFIKVPYILDYREEQKIYNDQIEGLKSKGNFEPHALESLCLFVIMTRIRSPLAKHYGDSKISKIATSLSPLEKTLFYADKKIPERFNSEESQILLQNYDQVLNEFELDNLYQGKFGLSPRDIKNIIYKLSSRHKIITFVEVLDYLSRLITKKNEYDFLNMTSQGDYHHPARFLEFIKSHLLDICDQEVRESLGLIDDRSYEEYIKNYIQTISATIKGEKVKNKITGKFEEPDHFFVKEFETSINLKEDAKKFRSHLIASLGAYSLDNPGTNISYCEVFPDLVTRLQESFRNEQKGILEKVSSNLVYFEANQKQDKNDTPLNQEMENQINTIISNLKNKHKYSQDGAFSILKYLIKERY